MGYLLCQRRGRPLLWTPLMYKANHTGTAESLDKWILDKILAYSWFNIRWSDVFTNE